MSTERTASVNPLTVTHHDADICPALLPAAHCMTAAPEGARADRVAARATGVGIGVLAFMITWLVGARVAAQIWGPPSSAVVAMGIAVAVGILIAVVAGRRLVRRQLSERPPRPLTPNKANGNAAAL